MPASAAGGLIRLKPGILARGLGGLWLIVGEEVCHELHCHPQDNQVE